MDESKEWFLQKFKDHIDFDFVSANYKLSDSFIINNLELLSIEENLKSNSKLPEKIKNVLKEVINAKKKLVLITIKSSGITETL